MTNYKLMYSDLLPSSWVVHEVEANKHWLVPAQTDGWKAKREIHAEALHLKDAPNWARMGLGLPEDNLYRNLLADLGKLAVCYRDTKDKTSPQAESLKRCLEDLVMSAEQVYLRDRSRPAAVGDVMSALWVIDRVRAMVGMPPISFMGILKHGLE